MEVKSMLPESFEKEEKDEDELAALVAPMRTIIHILNITQAVVLVLGILLSILFAVLSDGTTSTIVSAVVTMLLIFGGIVLMCYIAELRCHAKINQLAIEYQQRNLLKKLVQEEEQKSAGDGKNTPSE